MDFDVTLDRFDFSEIKGLSFDDLTLGEDAEGDATIHWESGSVEVASIHIELRGVDITDVTEDMFTFAPAAPLAQPAAAMAPASGATDAPAVLDGEDEFVFAPRPNAAAGDMQETADPVVRFDGAVDALSGLANLWQEAHPGVVLAAVIGDAASFGISPGAHTGLEGHTWFDDSLSLM